MMTGVNHEESHKHTHTLTLLKPEAIHGAQQQVSQVFQAERRGRGLVSPVLLYYLTLLHLMFVELEEEKW